MVFPLGISDGAEEQVQREDCIPFVVFWFPHSLLCFVSLITVKKPTMRLKWYSDDGNKITDNDSEGKTQT